MELRFVFKSSSGESLTHFKRLPVIIGRSDAGDVKLRIAKDAVSRRHCEFSLDDQGRVCVTDLESTNGTFLEGRRLEPRVPAPVSSGSTCRLGNVGFRVEYGGATVHESETVPIAPSAPPADLAGEEPAAPEPTLEVAPTAPLGEVVPTAQEPSGAADFGFLAGVDAAAPAADAWPQIDEAPPTDDAELDDFLKGLP